MADASPTSDPRPKRSRSLLSLPGWALSKAIRLLRSALLTRHVTRLARGARIVIADPLLPVKMEIDPTAEFSLAGRLTMDSFMGCREPIFIRLGPGSRLVIGGDFHLGPGCRLVVEPGAELRIGGRRHEARSGITERTQIIARRSIQIGVDLICSWRVFITDSDWHDTFEGVNTQETRIGDHVWITPNCSILKGSVIGNDCIVATGAVTHRAEFPDGALIAGQPGRVRALNRRWSGTLAPEDYSRPPQDSSVCIAQVGVDAPLNS